ncbi:MAG: trypsin-like peptidase domain-containing protein, partial [Sandaracinaceae bacterium]|nr:trypsin-like peptidase domain-containing protein [Sandaracinaceae bacterium]
MSRERRSLLLSTALWLITVFSLGAACASGVLLWTTRNNTPVAAGEPMPAPVVVTPRGDLSDAEQATVQLFENAAPSVVYITALSVRADYLRRNLLEIPEGTGSGFLWDDRGHVVTNFHVIRGADGARVTLADHSTWPAELVGVAAEKDIAVLRIRAPREVLRALPIGASHDLQVGQHVFAIGNPFGLDHTLSTGVISGLEREIMSVGNRPIQGVIQTDAAINPGNSGGPLLDSAGRLIGMNTSIVSPSGSSAGIGFAVPVDTIA